MVAAIAPARNPGFRLVLADGRVMDVRRATGADQASIQGLYARVYGERYPLSLVTDEDQLGHALADDNTLWMLQWHGSALVGSVVYMIDAAQRMAKACAAVVHRDYRGHALTERVMERVEPWLLEHGSCDVIVATTRTVSLAPQKVTAHMDYKQLGVLPNVHRVDVQETHGLTARFSSRALRLRRSRPVLRDELKTLFNICAQGVCLGEATWAGFQEAPIDPSRPGLRVTLQGPAVLQQYQRVQRRFNLPFRSTPFTQPNLLLTSTDSGSQVYLFREPADGHFELVGGFAGNHTLVTILHDVMDTCRGFGASYVELMVDAYNPAHQHAAMEAGMIPSAYFPAFFLQASHTHPSRLERLDHVVFTRSFVPLHVEGLNLFGSNHLYLDQYLQARERLLNKGADVMPGEQASYISA